MGLARATQETALLSFFALVLGCALLWAGEPWNEKPYTEWTKEEVEAILGNSPWVKRDIVTELRVEWASSLTMRQAMVRRMQLEGRLSEKEVAKPLLVTSGSWPEYLLVLRSAGVHGSDLTTWVSSTLVREPTPGEVKLYIQERTYLELQKSKRNVRPTRVQSVYDGQRISGAFLWFPRELDGKAVIGPDETATKFIMRGEARSANFVIEFDLRKMVRDGKPDL